MPKKRYSVGYLTTAYKEVVFSQDDLGVEIQWMWIANRTGSAATIEIAHVPSGSSPAESLDLINDLSVAANTYSVTEVGIYMEPGDKIVAKSNTAEALVLTFYGTESYPAPNLASPITAPRVVSTNTNRYLGDVL